MARVVALVRPAAALLTLALLVGVGAAPAFAQEDKRAAKKHLRAGDHHLTKGDRLRARGDEARAVEEFEAALAEYERAYQAFPSTKIFFPLGQVEERLGRDVEAFRHYEQLLADAGAIDDTLRARVEMRVEELKQRLAVVELDVEPAGAMVILDGIEVGPAPIDKPVPLVPGEHELKVTLEGHAPFSTTFTVEPGERPMEVVRLEPIDVAPEIVDEPAPALRRKVTRRRPAGRTQLVVGLSVASGCLGLAAITGLLASGKHGDFADTTLSPTERAEARDSGRTLALATDLLLVGAAAAGAYAAYTYYEVYRPAQRGERRRGRRAASPPRAEADRAAAVWVVPYASERGGSLVVGGSF
jgi:hypothetical protein